LNKNHRLGRAPITSTLAKFARVEFHLGAGFILGARRRYGWVWVWI
jgi:hypothetical protein